MNSFIERAMRLRANELQVGECQAFILATALIWLTLNLSSHEHSGTTVLQLPSSSLCPLKRRSLSVFNREGVAMPLDCRGARLGIDKFTGTETAYGIHRQSKGVSCSSLPSHRYSCSRPAQNAR